MNITKEGFALAAKEVDLATEHQDRLWAALERQTAHQPKFTFANVAVYLGGLIVISAMGWFMNLGWEAFGGYGIFGLGAGYAAAFAFAGRHLWFVKDNRVAGGVLFTVAVCMAPLAVYGLEKGLGFWPDGQPGAFRDFHLWVKATWLVMELATIAAALLALKWVRFPFLVAPIAFTLWYMSMDLTPLLFGRDSFSWNERAVVSACFGAFMLVVAFVVDRLVKDDFAFWLYLFGLLAFWGGLSFLDSHSEVGKAVYCAINAVLIFVGVLLHRRAFTVFGALGIFGYLGHLSSVVFKDSMLFPFALSGIGLFVIFAGTRFQRYQPAIEAAIRRVMPRFVLEALPNARA